MSPVPLRVHSPAPAPDGPIACSLHPNDHAGRLEAFRTRIFAHVLHIQRPEATRLRLVLAASADPEAVRELLVLEQGCCAFLAFTLTPDRGRLLADLRVPALAAPTLDALVMLARLAGEGR